MTRTIVAIDPGTNCGWAVKQNAKIIASGVWNLKGSRFEGGGMRFVHFKSYLNKLCDAYRPIDLVVFEEVRRHMGVDAAHVYGGIVAVLTAWCEVEKVPYTAIPVGTIKKHATGKGNANKDEMLQAANARWPGNAFTDDNEADARFIADAATL
jgi:Holliday junction resolvasome RuvABC endonuclease subunit